MECYSDARSHRDTHCCYLGVHNPLVPPFAYHNVHLGAVGRQEDLHSKGVVPVAKVPEVHLAVLLCYCTSCVVGVP
jgi:hypothetical protein